MDRLVKLRMKQPKRIMREMLAAVLLDQLNLDQAAERYKVNRLTVLRWIRKVEEEAKVSKQTTSIASDQPSLPARKSTQRSTPEKEVKRLQTKLQSLEIELETANFKALYYSTLVRVAKLELGVDVEKKSVTKPTNKRSTKFRTGQKLFRSFKAILKSFNEHVCYCYSEVYVINAEI